MGRDEHPPVDFVVGSDNPASATGDMPAEAPEILPAAEPPTRRTRPIRLDLIIAAAVLLLAALIGRALTNQSKTPAQAPTPPTTTLVHPSLPSGTSEIIPLHNQGNPAQCPRADDGLSICSSRRRVGAIVLAAITARFPRASTQRVLDEQLRDVGFGPGGIWYRQIVAVSGARRIVIEIHRLRDTDVARFGSRTVGGAHQVFAVHLTPLLAVQVSVTGPVNRPADLGAVRDLAADLRLLA